MSLQWNKRTQKWTDEKLGTVTIEKRPIKLLEQGWKPTGDYWRDWEDVKRQVEGVVNELQADETSRRGTVTLRGYGDYWPCLVAFQFMIRNARLVAFFYWRSSSTTEHNEDVRFMRWVTAQVAAGLNYEDLQLATIYAFRASDHEVLADPGEKGLPSVWS